jgi:quercetin dioxygenase-like cupin family protein
MLRVNLGDVRLEDNSTAGGPIRVAFPFSSAVGTAGSAAVLFELEPEAMLASHKDSAEEGLLVLEGTADAVVGDERARLGPGQLAVVPPMVTHGVRNVGSGTLRVLGFFSSSTVVATFEEPLMPEGPQVMVIGTPTPVAATLEEAVRA